MAVGWRDLRKRNEDEKSFEHAWMRNLEIRSGDRFVAIEQDVQIDEAGAFGEVLLAAHGRFDFSHPAQEFLRRQISFGFEDRIQEPERNP